jgi:hypothetical protein
MSEEIGRHYCLLTELYQQTLVSKVDKMIDDGWQPLGAPYYANTRYTQAMVRIDRSHIETVIREAFSDDLSALDLNSRA